MNDPRDDEFNLTHEVPTTNRIAAGQRVAFHNGNAAAAADGEPDFGTALTASTGRSVVVRLRKYKSPVSIGTTRAKAGTIVNFAGTGRKVLLLEDTQNRDVRGQTAFAIPLPLGMRRATATTAPTNTAATSARTAAANQTNDQQLLARAQAAVDQATREFPNDAARRGIRAAELMGLRMEPADVAAAVSAPNPPTQRTRVMNTPTNPARERTGATTFHGPTKKCQTVTSADRAINAAYGAAWDKLPPADRAKVTREDFIVTRRMADTSANTGEDPDAAVRAQAAAVWNGRGDKPFVYIGDRRCASERDVFEALSRDLSQQAKLDRFHRRA